MHSTPTWVFGYGSIIWKVDFEVTESLVGYIDGFVRRFYQGSTDHRGTPEKPGRVVTLLPSTRSDEKVWGVAYRIPDEKTQETLAHLDYREKGGFTRSTTIFYPRDSRREPFRIIVYVAVEGNINYLGPAPLDEMARTIAFTRGPSGPNIDYLMNLCDSMRKIAPGVIDEHLNTLEEAVKVAISEKRIDENPHRESC
ncbi:putative glutathione-specific gamma-glutamylcyclotransferase 2 [Galendromus occidentalis]|uniref:glutathione-specific gamma-glutamylcyclotransferase n=1 Tax=Galendromus occidentalis TaxID=34638 RepID=A0AAJ6VY58_9ACAR|nr:putative glutathione-specific gamma-glutamylcyclotransferase 2 [Galendromus occidentalis]